MNTFNIIRLGHTKRKSMTIERFVSRVGRNIRNRTKLAQIINPKKSGNTFLKPYFVLESSECALSKEVGHNDTL